MKMSRNFRNYLQFCNDSNAYAAMLMVLLAILFSMSPSERRHGQREVSHSC